MSGCGGVSSGAVGGICSANGLYLQRQRAVPAALMGGICSANGLYLHR
jgi:hypothetical protein